MLNIIKNFIQKLNKDKGFEKELIKILVNDHQKLVEVFTEINNNIQKDDFAATRASLKKFVKEYNKHILLEDTKLYIALEEKYKTNDHILNLVKQMSKDMNTITDTILFFERKHSAKLDKNTKDEFIEELNKIGEVLLERVSLEEERLYTLL